MSSAQENAAGREFIRHMMVILAAGIVVYGLLHVFVSDRLPSDAPGCTESLSGACFARIDAFGDVHFRHAGEVSWYVGRATAMRVRDRTHLNSQRMDELRRRVALRAATQLAPLLNDRAPVDRLIIEVSSGRSAAAQATFVAIVDSLSTSTANAVTVELGELSADLDRLIALRRHQEALVEELTPPLARLFFWTSPSFSMLEVLFWALFGVLTNLLVNSAEFLRQGIFKPEERWVAYTKLMYGPVLALILVFAMINGFFQPESYEVRVWTLPLVSFLFGYASRRTARLIDQLLERFLGATEVGIEAGPDPVRAARLELVDKLMVAYEPRDLPELRSQLKRLAAEIVESEALARERS